MGSHYATPDYGNTGTCNRPLPERAGSNNTDECDNALGGPTEQSGKSLLFGVIHGFSKGTSGKIPDGHLSQVLSAGRLRDRVRRCNRMSVSI